MEYTSRSLVGFVLSCHRYIKDRYFLLITQIKLLTIKTRILLITF